MSSGEVKIITYLVFLPCDVAVKNSCIMQSLSILRKTQVTFVDSPCSCSNNVVRSVLKTNNAGGTCCLFKSSVQAIFLDILWLLINFSLLLWCKSRTYSTLYIPDSNTTPVENTNFGHAKWLFLENNAFLNVFTTWVRQNIGKCF